MKWQTKNRLAGLVTLILIVGFLSLKIGDYQKQHEQPEFYCTPQVKQVSYTGNSELECQLTQLTIDYIKEHKNLEIDFKIKYVYVYDDDYKNYYRTITTISFNTSNDEAPWEILWWENYDSISIWFDKKFNVVRVNGKNKEKK